MKKKKPLDITQYRILLLTAQSVLYTRGGFCVHSFMVKSYMENAEYH